MIVRLERFTIAEIERLHRQPTDTDAGAAFQTALFAELVRRPGTRYTRVRNGRWERLTWFTQTDRILPADQLPAAIARWRDD